LGKSYLERKEEIPSKISLEIPPPPQEIIEKRILSGKF